MSTNHMVAAGNYQNLFVAKLHVSVTDAELMAVFADYNPSSATVMLDPVSGRSKGYAFVLFSTEDLGRNAAAALDKQVMTIARPDGESFTFELTIFASKHSGREVAAENECLYIRNIPNSWPMANVERFIAQHGKPVYSAVRSDHLGSPVWVVFVEYDSIESARKTLKALHGMSLGPRSPPILAKFAESEDVKKNRRNRKMGRPRYNAADVARDEEAAPTNSLVDNACESFTTSKARQRIDVAHQMHHPCHATHYDTTGSRVPVDSMDVESLKIKSEAPSPFSALPRPRSFNQSSGSIQLPLPRSKQTPVASPTTTAPQNAYFSCDMRSQTYTGFDGYSTLSKMPVQVPTPMSTTGSNHYISSSSSSSSSGRADDSLSPSSTRSTRYRHNPYAQAPFVPNAIKN